MLCWLLRMGNAVLLHLNHVSILHVELHPSPEPIWSEIGISQFLLDLFQFRFSMLWGTEPVPFGTRAIQIWTRSIPVSLPKMRKWYQRRNRRRRRRKPSSIANIIQYYCLVFYYNKHKFISKIIIQNSTDIYYYIYYEV